MKETTAISPSAAQYRAELEAELAARGLGGTELRFFELTDSTNTRARLFAAAGGGAEPVLFVADGQSAGRGRRGRRFLSPQGTGLFMSLLLRPSSPVCDAPRLTVLAAVAVRAAVAALTGAAPTIKWVNDIYLGERKLAGILCEGAASPTGDRLDHAVIGIGVNVGATRFEGELADIACDIESATGKRISRAALAAEITERLIAGLARVGTAELIEEYRAHSMLAGREVTVFRADGASYAARVVGIADDAALLVERSSGERERLSSGEVSVRPCHKFEKTL